MWFLLETSLMADTAMRRRALGLQAGVAAVVTNGRLVPLAEADPLVAEDFELLTLYANAAQVAKQVCEFRCF